MMGRGVEGGCGAGESSCRIHKLRIGARDSCGKNPVGQNSDVKSSSGKNLVYRQNCRNEEEAQMRVDVFIQALKALAVKPPFETEDGTLTGSLPASVSQISGKHSGAGDGRRKHRKVQGRGQDGVPGGKIGGASQNKDGKHSKLWVEMDDYFREVTAEDVESLLPRTHINVCDASEVGDPCLSIPPSGIYYREDQQTGADRKLTWADVKTHRKDSEPGKIEGQDDRANAKQDSKDGSPECIIDRQGQGSDGQVQVDVEQDQADGPRSRLMSPKQESSSGERIALVMPPEQESNAIIELAAVGPSEQESSSCLNIVPAVPPKQESSTGMTFPAVMPPMYRPISGAKLAALLSFPMQVQGSGSSLAAVASHKQESRSDTKLAPLVISKQELCPGTKLAALALSPKQELTSDGKLAAVGLLPNQESNSGAKYTEAVYAKQETSSIGKLAGISSPEQEFIRDSKVTLEAFSVEQEPSTATRLAAQTSQEQKLNPIAEIAELVSLRKKESVSMGKLTAGASTRQEPSCGAKRKLLAASLRSKKKKLSETPAEVITTVISPPENGDEELCHVCYGGDSEEWNQILFCDSCDVAVHQECYGVREIPDGQWLCSWCLYRSHLLCKSSDKHESNYISHQEINGGEDSEAWPCILCPNRGGALKPVAMATVERENHGNLQFAHLFCCQWVPETYIENTETMEPIKNSEGVREARWKFLCSLCKEKHGACIQCSHGMCAAAFHPLCAREAKLRMGISSKEGGDDVDLWAFCSKHSLARVGRASSSRNGSADGPPEVAPCSDKVMSHLSDETCTGQENQLSHIESRYHSKHTKMFSKEIADEGTSDQGVFFGNCRGIEMKISDLDNGVQASYTITGLAPGSLEKTAIGSGIQVKTGDSLEGVDLAVESPLVLKKGSLDCSEAIHSSESKESIEAGEADNFCNLLANLRKAVEQGQIILTDVAAQMGVSLNLLTSLIQGRKYKISADLKRKITAWICSDNFISTAVHEFKAATENENSLVIKTSDPNDLIRDSVQYGRLSKRKKNKKRLLKAPWSNREYTFPETSSSLCKERPERDVAVGELSSHHEECPDNELGMGVQNVQGGDQNQLGVVIAATEMTDIVRAMQNNSVLKGFEQRSLKLGITADISSEFGSGYLDEEMQQKENWRQAESERTKQKYSSASILTKTEAGIGGSDVEKDSIAKHASVNIQAGAVFDCKELHHFGLNESVCMADALKGSSIGEDPDANLERSNAWSNLDASEVHEHAMDIVSTDKLIGYVDIECVKKDCEPHVHPLIQKRLVELQHGLASAKGDQRIQFDDQWESDVADGESHFCGTDDVERETDPNSIVSSMAAASKDSQWKQLIETRNAGILDLVPEDEIEGEILFLQNNLLECAVANRHRSENLILRVITNLSEEQQALRRRRWDAVLVSHYLGQAREAKKQGRKERRHKEAQAFLAAATAAAAASPRLGSARKDGLGDSLEEQGAYQVSFSSKPSVPVDWGIAKAGFSSIFPASQPMKVSLQKPLKGSIVSGWPGSSQTMLRAKETLSKPIVTKVSSERQFDADQLLSGSPKEDSLPCDICRLQESTRLNKVYVCRNCKVAVHQDCYGISRISFGGWYCQPCEELYWQYQGTRLPAALGRGRPGSDVECALCGGLTGALKRSTDGQWVHVFCAEWMLESTFRKGQVDPVGGLETVARERYAMICSICHRHQGACLKCSFGHCHNAFHPLCARDSGFYMTVSTQGGKVQHKAYCEKHSPEQRAKESRRYGGSEELRIIKQMRVELERVRLICERIVRREKLKRELLHCSHNILASKRDCVAFSAVFHSSFLPPDISSHADRASGSAVISLRGHGDENKSWKHHSAGIPQRLDEYSVESTASGQFRENLPGRSDLYHPTSALDDIGRHGRVSAGSSLLGGKSIQSGKSLAYPIKSGAADDRDDEYKRPKKSRKHAETLKREVVMTPTEASVQNRRLPKGYAYVPVVYLAKGKTTTQDVEPQNP